MKGMDSMDKNLNPKRLIDLIKHANPPKKRISFAILIGIIETIAGLLVPLLLMQMVNQFADGGLSYTLLLIAAAALIGQAILSGVSFYLMTSIGEGLVSAIRNRVWAHVLKLTMPYFDEHESGETMSRITQDTNVVKELITQHLINFLNGLLAIIGSVIILLFIDWKMTLLMLIAVPLTVLTMMPLGRKMHGVAVSNQDALAKFTGNLGRVLSNIRMVKAYQAEKLEIDKGKAQIHELYRYGLKEAKIMALLSPIMTLIMMLVVIVLFGYGGAQVATGAISAGELVAIMFYLIQIIVPFTQMASFFTSFQKALGATERLNDILSLPIEQGGAQHLPIDEQNIVLQNINFRYNEKPVLQELSAILPKGQITALVGASGGGKTTIFSLLERFYNVNKGSLLYGEQRIEQINLHEWRSLFGYVSQESPIMSGTIRDNVLYGSQQKNDKDVKEALIQANAWSFVAHFPNQLDEQVGEGGMKLSGGQRQRIAIARAILRNPKILLLDEATSSLDNESEHAVQEALTRLMTNRTTLIIAHRLSTIKHANQILVLENGEITGRGTHEELMKSHPYYQKLQQLSSKQLDSE
ncbi:ABC transporter ATP-binding protein [Solibacillus sp. FSL R7-0682]|uniref:ABC transporter ATP-binding protein n=1 Tax=Solibacillus sp. FSL R7-0682 TaxID=2921690 RepID=UPI004040B17C